MCSSDLENDQVRGYEMRGYGGYKSKAAGSDSSSSAWVADLSGGNQQAVKNVFFCESAFDAMAFYQQNQSLLKNDTALVSLGGTFSDGQVQGVMKRFSNARPFDCFDNDLPGRIYGLRMLSLLEDIPMRINKVEDVIRIEAKGKTFDLVQGRSFLEQLSEQLSIRYTMGQWLPPKAFKDWNDRSEEHTSELQSLRHLVGRLLLEKMNSSHIQKSRTPALA